MASGIPCMSNSEAGGKSSPEPSKPGLYRGLTSADDNFRDPWRITILEDISVTQPGLRESPKNAWCCKRIAAFGRAFGCSFNHILMTCSYFTAFHFHCSGQSAIRSGGRRAFHLAPTVRNLRSAEQPFCHDSQEYEAHLPVRILL